MPATSTSPVKILLDLGIDLDNLSSEEDYLSALMEASAMLQASGQTDQRFKILTDEVRAVRKSRKAAAPSKGMKASYKRISAASFKRGKKSSQGINKVFSAGPSQGGQGGDLLVIKEKVVSIEALLGEQYKLQEENAKDAKEEAEKKKRSLKERLLEGGKNVWGGIKKVAGTVLKPFKSIWTQILDFIKTVFLGKVLKNILEWGAKKENQSKITSIFKFLKDWWPVLLTAYLAFGNGLSKFVLGLVGKLAIWGAKLLAKVIPALFKAIAAMGPKGWLALGLGAGAIGLTAYMSRKDDPDLVGQEEGGQQDTTTDGSTEETQKLNKGGQVAGSGNTDTVPAMLTPGEFVMSKGAVQRYGADTLAGMNAAAGGTNIPTLMGGYNEGGFAKPGVVTDPKEKAQQEAYMLKFVNEERLLQGLEPLNDLTYAPGVELTKMMGPGPKTTETSDTDMNFDTGMKSTWKTKSRGGETIFQGSSEMITQEDRDKFFAANPHAAQLVALKDQMELDALGADISASAKMNGGGLVRGFKEGGLVQGFQGGGSVGVLGGIGNIMQGRTWGGESRGQIGRSVSKVKNISKLSKKKPKVVVVDESPSVDSSESQLPQSRSREIPNFDATAKRSPRKMEVLGISL